MKKYPRAGSLSLLWVATSFVLLECVLYFVPMPTEGSTDTRSAYQSPLPERTEASPAQVGTVGSSKPSTWILSAEGGSRRFGAVTLHVPAGFTHQGGADIRAFLQATSQAIQLPSGIVPGTLFSVGIWPPNDQAVFEKPIELRVLIDPSHLRGRATSDLQLLQYQPATKTWMLLPSSFEIGAYQVVGSVLTFTPVAKDFPTWGNQTFFAVSQGSHPDASSAGKSALRSNANFRSGPGTSFPIVRRGVTGESVRVDGKSADGRWLQLADGTWVAAFLVANPPNILPIVK